MPGRILDIVRVDRLVQLELLAAVYEAPGIEECDTTLPELRCCGW
jgi:hypothetical protein